MGRCTISLSRSLLLLAVLGNIALVLVLPQVDLLDTAFHGNTSPLAVHARATAGRAALTFASASLFSSPTGREELRREHKLSVRGTPNSLLILNHSLRC